MPEQNFKKFNRRGLEFVGLTMPAMIINGETTINENGEVSNINESDGIFKSGNTKIPSTIVSTERLINGELNNWQTNDVISNWSVTTPVGGDPAVYSKSQDAHTGTYALKMITHGVDFLSLGYLMDAVVNQATAGQSAQFVVWAKKILGNNVSLVGLAEYQDGETVMVYNFSGENIGTFTPELDEPSADQLEVKTLTNGYSDYTFTSVTFPEGVTDPTYLIIGFGDSADASLVIDDASFLVNGIETATNLSFETWGLQAREIAPIDDWTYVNSNWDRGGDQTANSYIDLITDVPGGQGLTYSAKMYLGSGPGNLSASARQYIYQTYTGTPGTSIDVSFYYKNATGSVDKGYLLFIDGLPNSFTNAYAFGTSDWQFPNAQVVDFPETASGSVIELNVDNTWTLVEQTVTIPASGDLTLILMSGKAEMNTFVDFSVAGISAIENVVIPANTVTAGVLSTPSDAVDLEATDTVFQVKTTGGAPKNFFRQNGLGAFTTDFDRFDYSSKPVAVAEPSLPGDAATQSYVNTAITDANEYKVFATPLSSEINLMSTESTPVDLYTVPTGYTFYPTGLGSFCTDATNPSMSSTGYVQLGVSPNYNDLQSIPPSSSLNRMSVISYNIAFPTFASGSVIKLKVQGAASGYDSFKGEFALMGYLVAN